MVDPFDSFRSREPARAHLACSRPGPRPLDFSPQHRSACRHGADAGEACAAHPASRPPRQPRRFRSSRDSRRRSAGSRPGSRPPLPSLRGRCSRNREPRDPSSSSCSKVKSRCSRVEGWLPPEARVRHSARRPCSRAGRAPRHSWPRRRFPRSSPTSGSSTGCSSRSPRSPSGFVPSRRNAARPRRTVLNLSG